MKTDGNVIIYALIIEAPDGISEEVLCLMHTSPELSLNVTFGYFLTFNRKRFTIMGQRVSWEVMELP